MSPDSAETERALALVLRHGSAATSFQTLQPGFRYFFHGSDACVAYVDTGGAWVAAGEPLAALACRARVVSAFLDAARRAGKRACFFGTESALVGVLGERLSALAIGEQPVWDPRDWAARLSQHRSLREQLRRARAKGVRTREVLAAELEAGPLRQQITRVMARWLASRSMAPMGFLVKIEPFELAAQRRTFIAERDGVVLGFAGVVPVPARGGWFLEDLVRDPEAPNGTSELLVHTVMQWASANDCSWLTLGLSPLSGPLPPLLATVRRHTRWLYDFTGLRAYKAKFTPREWKPLHLCFPPTQPQWLTVVDTLRAFASGGLLRFGARTLWRDPPLVLRALSTLLVPWTFFLTLAPAEHWFGAGWLKWAWLGFDVLLSVGLGRLLRRPQAKWFTALGLAVTTDAVVTTLEAWRWHAEHALGRIDGLLLVLACVGPALGACLLWGARQRNFARLFGPGRPGKQSRSRSGAVSDAKRARSPSSAPNRRGRAHAA